MSRWLKASCLLLSGLALGLGWWLPVPEPAASPRRAPDPRAPREARPRGVVLAPATAVPEAPGFAARAEAASSPLEELLERLDEDPARGVSPDELARLEAAWVSPSEPLPLRAGALRAALERGGREALGRAVEAFGAALDEPLQELVADAVAAGAAPGDAALLARLLDRSEPVFGAREMPAHLRAARAAARAARRASDPVPLGPALELRVTDALASLAFHGHAAATRTDAVAELARLATPQAVKLLEVLAGHHDGLDEERSLEAALALRRVDAARGGAALAALRPLLRDEALRRRLDVEAREVACDEPR